MIAEFESDLISTRIREGLATARAASKLRGRKPKLTIHQQEHLVQRYRAGEISTSHLAELIGVGRTTVYWAIDRAAPADVRG